MNTTHMSVAHVDLTAHHWHVPPAPLAMADSMVPMHETFGQELFRRKSRRTADPRIAVIEIMARH